MESDILTELKPFSFYLLHYTFIDINAKHSERRWSEISYNEKLFSVSLISEDLILNEFQLSDISI